jgi:lipoprotein-releasing system permease protein
VTPESKRRRALIEIGIGALLFIAGVVITALSLRVAQTTRPRGGGMFIVAIGPIFTGMVTMVHGVVRLLPNRAQPMPILVTSTPEARIRSLIAIAAGFGLILLAIILSAATAEMIEDPTARNLVAYAPAGLGTAALVFGLVTLRPLAGATAVALELVPGIGYRSFVAWRYLLAHPHRISMRTKVACVLLLAIRLLLWLAFGVGLRFASWDAPLHVLGLVSIGALACCVFWGILRHSKVATIIFLFGIALAILCNVIGALAMSGYFTFLTADTSRQIAQVVGIVSLCGAGLAGLVAFFGTLRGFFTFFTTVPIGGVWIGTAALVLVLAVMSGFETDLRDKILGSNAHIQVTREDGDFVNWREAKAKIDKIPGVVASTPYAVSEVVIAANNNGMNVIIKGIDPDTVAKVTDLVSDLDDPEAMRRLEPLVDVKGDRNVPQAPRGTVIDPPPDDMPVPGDPIDFSGEGSAATPPPPSPPPDPKPAHAGPAGGPDVEPYGGDAARIIDQTGFDPLLDSPMIQWFVGEYDFDTGPAVTVIDASREPLSRRTQALHGILVGRELVKQTHLYTGEEVRVVSPLSDPSNPDATGTPIPFNRDYRVAGVFYTGMYEYDLKYVYVTLDSLQNFLDLGDTVDGIEIRIESADDTGRYVPTGDGTGPNAGLIREALGPGYRVVDWRELNRSLFSALKLEKIAMFLVLGIVILVASFSIIGNLIMVVVEKAREIALLKTLGASDTGVMQLFAIQGLIIGLIGTALGVMFGLLGCTAMEEFGLPLNPDVYYIDRLPIHVDTQSVIAAAITGVAISIGATLYPALLAARVRPAAGMRH